MKATYTVNSWAELVENVLKIRHSSRLRCDQDEELWFRGVGRNTYPLLPSLHRCMPGANHVTLLQLENNLFFEFLAKARTANGIGLEEWDALFIMQHYRAPTRLLDWTEVFLVAVYFAISYRLPNEAEPARIWVMNPYLWNEMHHPKKVRDLQWPKYFGWDNALRQYYDYGELLVEADGIDWSSPVALYAPQRDVRLSAQRGYFTIHGTDPRPLEEISPKLLISIDLERDGIREAQQQLDLAGINEFSLFPDLEGLSRYLRKRYTI